MDRLTQLREAGGSSSLNSSVASEGYTTANESSKYFSIDSDSSLDVTPTKDSDAAEQDKTLAPDLISSLSPVSKKSFDYKIGDKIEAANILSGGVDIFDDNENSYDEDGLVIDDNAGSLDDKSSAGIKSPDSSNLASLKTEVLEDTVTPSKDTEVVLQIDGKNVDAIVIGNGLYLYRKEVDEELAAVQIIDDQPQPTFKFLKVRENDEGNLEVYEEIEVEVPKEISANETKQDEGSTSHVPIKDIDKIISENTNKSNENVKVKKSEIVDNIIKISENANEGSQVESKKEINFSAKIKLSEARKSPVIGSFTPMTFHSTPNKEGIPLTKTMVDQQLQPTNRHSDNVKKTIEVHTDSIKLKSLETFKDMPDYKPPVLTSSSTETCDSNLQTESCMIKSNLNTKGDIPVTTFIEPKPDSSLGGIQVPRQDRNNKSNDLSDIVKSKPADEVQSEVSQTQHNTICNEENTLKKKEICFTQKSNKSQISNVENIEQNRIIDNPEKIDKNLCKSETSVTEVSINENKKSATLTIAKNLLSEEHITHDNSNLKESMSNTLNIPQQVSNKCAETKKIELEKKNIPQKVSIDCAKTKKIELEKQNIPQQLSNKCAETKKSELEKQNIPHQVSNKFIETKKTELEKKPSTREKEESKASLLLNFQNEDKIPKTIPINNNHTAVPFGKWTEANKQDFLKKIKESKVPTNISNTNQIKHSNDLNRRDILQKIDRKRLLTNLAQRNLTLEVNTSLDKATTTSKVNLAQNIVAETKIESPNPLIVKTNSSKEINVNVIPPTKQNPVSGEPDLLQVLNPKNTYSKKMQKQNILQQPASVPISIDSDLQKPQHRTGFNNQVLIDRTIEDLLHRTDIRPPEVNNYVVEKDKVTKEEKQNQIEKSPALDAIEKKMNELHGIPFVERPPHELPQRYNHNLKSYKSSDDLKGHTKSTVPNLLPIVSNKIIKDVVEIDSEEEIIEHEPVTGDVDLIDKADHMKSTASISKSNANPVANKDVIITEKAFDKFARTKSFPYGNNVTAKQNQYIFKTIDKKESSASSKSKIPQTAQSSSSQKSASSAFYDKLFSTSTLMQSESSYRKNVHSKLQVAYQSAVTIKKEKEPPVTILEDKPVKLVYMESVNAHQRNVQIKEPMPNKTPELQYATKLHELLPAHKLLQPTATTVTPIAAKQSDVKKVEQKDDNKTKTKHVRKQELKPVESPELELIEPRDLFVSSKKKRRVETPIDNNKSEAKNIVPKKSYLLGREPASSVSNVEHPLDQGHIINSAASFNNPSQKAISAIDSLVKAAELLESQSINKSDQESPQTPAKRGRGRPRKYPVSENSSPLPKTVSPQKRPRLTDSKLRRSVSTEEESSSDDEMLRENWTMGKINENIVCPICNKLFRSENVVFKHVKHCTGPSPSRSDSDRRSSRRSTHSQESSSRSGDNKSSASDTEDLVNVTPKRPKDLLPKISDEVIVIEDTPLKDKKENVTQQNKYQPITQKGPPSNHQLNTKALACEYCGKTFRQYSYLVSHKLIHKNEEKKPTNVKPKNPIFSCEVCKKEFRKPYHLAQHRMIHKPTLQPRSQRKSNPEQNDNKIVAKPEDDQSTGFRCEPCDKSFRKLHHLVEHRETHDGKHKASIVTQAPTEKEQLPPQCDVCKKTFRKLHHLIEHRQQHAEHTTDRLDDKDAKSSLSTKDIIHECSLCYMVFPNEHALNKHSLNCARKKKQSVKNTEVESTNSSNVLREPLDPVEELQKTSIKNEVNVEIKEDNQSNDNLVKSTESVDSKRLTESQHQNKKETNTIEVPLSKQSNTQSITKVETETKLDIQENPKPSASIKVNNRISNQLPSGSNPKVIEKESPKKRLITKTKSETETVTKRSKISDETLPVVKEKSEDNSDDDDDVRYMINPNFDSNATKATFLKIRAQKRNSLQIERPNSKDLITRRTSLQQFSKIKAKSRKSEDNIKEPTKSVTLPKNTSEFETVPSDTDDAEVKYAFPEMKVETEKAAEKESVSKKIKVSEKRKTLTGIAKRKSMGKSSTPKPGSTKSGSPKKNVAMKKDLKRRPQVEHICDCGKHFSSSVLLSHHITAAHTPPRIRLARPPINQVSKKPPPKTTTDTRKSSVKSDASTKPSDARKSVAKSKTDGAPSFKSAKKTPAHKGVPIPEGLRKRMEKIKK